jgi:CubicO group peptidase (beta-lactamase class C family)
MSLRFAGLLVLLLCGACATSFPRRRWEHVTTTGWSACGLQAAKAYSFAIGSAAVIVVQHGRVVAEWGDVQRKLEVHSIRKSLLNALIGTAVARGRIRLDATLSVLGIDEISSLTDEEKRATVRDLLAGKSGVYLPASNETEAQKRTRPLRGSHAHGTHWFYNNWDFNVLGSIYSNATGKDIGTAFAEEIATPIGMQDYSTADFRLSTSDESRYPGYLFRMSARDLARFGLLYLNHGKWADKQLVPMDWVTKSTTSAEEVSRWGGYGYLWWVEVNHQHFPGVDLGGGAFSARGFGGHMIVVVPKHDLVLVHRTDTDHGVDVSDDRIARLIELILDAEGTRHGH